MACTVSAEVAVHRLATRTIIRLLAQFTLQNLHVLLRNNLITRVRPARQQLTSPTMTKYMPRLLSMCPWLLLNHCTKSHLLTMTPSLSGPRLLRHILRSQQKLSILDIYHNTILNQSLLSRFPRKSQMHQIFGQVVNEVFLTLEVEDEAVREAFAEGLPGAVLAGAEGEHVRFASHGWAQAAGAEGEEGREVGLEGLPRDGGGVFEEDDVRVGRAAQRLSGGGRLHDIGLIRRAGVEWVHKAEAEGNAESSPTFYLALRSVTFRLL